VLWLEVRGNWNTGCFCTKWRSLVKCIKQINMHYILHVTNWFIIIQARKKIVPAVSTNKLHGFVNYTEGAAVICGAVLGVKGWWADLSTW